MTKKALRKKQRRKRKKLENKPHAKTYATEADAKRAKKWLLEHGVRSVDIAVKINNKPAGSLKDDKPSEAEQKGFWWEK